MLGLTATATQKVKEDVTKCLGISDKVLYFQSSFNRPNLFYEIRNKQNIKNVDEDIANLIKTRFKDKCGIIYTTTRKACEKLSEKLRNKHGIKCNYYHADIKYEIRSEA